MTRVALVMAGGTGGHVFPALATARVLQKRGYDIVWLGTQRGIESRLVPAAGIPVEWLSVSGLRGKGLLTLLVAPVRLTVALFQALRAVRKHRPSVVLGAGGFASGPGGVAAWLLRRPLVVHEQNAVAGMTNRLLGRLADRVLEGFPGSFGRGVRAEHVGNPVRPEIAAVPPPQRRYGAREGRVRLLVFGGSQGAARLNAVVPAALAELPAALQPEVIHQTGRTGYDETVAAYQSRGIEADVRPFIDDMAGAYGWADMAVCRSGALTVAELAAAGVPAVLVPFPAAVDDHQTRNAEYVVRAGAAVLLPERELTPVSLAATLRNLLEAGRPRLAQMAAAARGTAITDADERLADACVAAAGEAS
jgi:UDP-N-acetylglucosamine--N-acetylmuramyl-(pentapeptide) pyrophosphoryl-undecaprenol N-acetylglucosamine transferase